MTTAPYPTLSALAIVVAAVSFLAPGLAAAQADPTAGLVPIRFRTTIERSWEQVKSDKFAYGPKQEVDPKTGETHVWLPYGKNPKLYADVQGVLFDPAEHATNGRAFLQNQQDASTSVRLTYKTVFSKPITSFRFEIACQEINLGENAVAGIEYSLNDKAWTVIHQVKKADLGAVEKGFRFGVGKVVTIQPTQQLFLRVYARSADDAEARHGDTRWLKIMMAGDPAWGDASKTFFANQPQLWVDAKK